MPTLHPVLNGEYTIDRYQGSEALNASLCLRPDEPCTSSSSQTAANELPTDWLRRLAASLYDKSSNYNSQHTDQQKKAEIDRIHQSLLAHAGPDSDYPGRGYLNSQLKQIYAYIFDLRDDSESLSQNKKDMICFQLVEGVYYCSEGFHNRANSVLEDLNEPQNIDDILSKLRYYLVRRKIAHLDPGGNVHNFNSAFCVAYQMGLGVRPINPEDQYPGPIQVATLTKRLRETFDKYWQPLAIMKQVFDRIKQQLNNKDDVKNGVQSGYTFAVYEKQIQFLDKLFKDYDVNESPYYTYLVFNDDFEVKGLNWTAVAKTLWRYLNDQGYFTLGKGFDLAVEKALAFEGVEEQDLDTLAGINDQTQMDALLTLTGMATGTKLKLICKANNLGSLPCLPWVVKCLNQGSGYDEWFISGFADLLNRGMRRDGNQNWWFIRFIGSALKQLPADTQKAVIQCGDQDGILPVEAAFAAGDNVFRYMLRLIEHLDRESQATILLAPTNRPGCFVDLAVTSSSNNSQDVLSQIIYNALTTHKRWELLRHEIDQGQPFIIRGLLRNSSCQRGHPVVWMINDLKDAGDTQALAHILQLSDRQGYNVLNRMIKDGHIGAAEPLLEVYFCLDPQYRASVLQQPATDGFNILGSIIDYFKRRHQGPANNEASKQAKRKLTELLTSIKELDGPVARELLFYGNGPRQENLVFEASKTGDNSAYQAVINVMASLPEADRLAYLRLMDDDHHSVFQRLLHGEVEVKHVMAVMQTLSQPARQKLLDEHIEPSVHPAFNAHLLRDAIHEKDMPRFQQYLIELSAFNAADQFNIVTGEFNNPCATSSNQYNIVLGEFEGTGNIFANKHLLKLTSHPANDSFASCLAQFIADNWHERDIVRLLHHKQDNGQFDSRQFIECLHHCVMDPLKPLFERILRSDDLTVFMDNQLLLKIEQLTSIKQEFDGYIQNLQNRPSHEIKKVLTQRGVRGEPFIINLLQSTTESSFDTKLARIKKFVPVFKVLTPEHKTDILLNWTANDGSTFMSLFIKAYINAAYQEESMPVMPTRSADMSWAEPYLDLVRSLNWLQAHQLQSIIQNNTGKNGALLREIVGKRDDFSSEKGPHLQGLLDQLFDVLLGKCPYETVFEQLTGLDEHHNNLLMLAVKRNARLEKFLKLVADSGKKRSAQAKLEKLFEQINDQNQNVFMLAASFAGQRQIQTLWSRYTSLKGVPAYKRAAVLTQKDDQGNTVLHCALSRQDLQTKESRYMAACTYLLELYSKELTPQQFMELLDTNDWNKSDLSLIRRLIEAPQKSEKMNYQLRLLRVIDRLIPPDYLNQLLDSYHLQKLIDDNGRRRTEACLNQLCRLMQKMQPGRPLDSMVLWRCDRSEVLLNVIDKHGDEGTINNLVKALSNVSADCNKTILQKTNLLSYLNICADIKPLMRLVQKLDVTEQYNVFDGINGFYHTDPISGKAVNLLELCLRHHPHKFTVLLDSFEQLPHDSQLKILLEYQDPNGLSLISHLMVHKTRDQQNALFPALMATISKLPVSYQAQVLSKPDRTGFNPMMSVLANRLDLAGYCADAMERMQYNDNDLPKACFGPTATQHKHLTLLSLTLSDPLPLDQSQRIWSIFGRLSESVEKSQIINTTLQTFSHNHPNRVNSHPAADLSACVFSYAAAKLPSMFSYIERQTPETQMELLNAVNQSGLALLSYAGLYYQAEQQKHVMGLFVAAVSKLPPQCQAQVLAAADSTGYNPAMSFITYRPELFEQMANLIQGLPPGYQVPVFNNFLSPAAVSSAPYSLLNTALHYAPHDCLDRVLNLLAQIGDTDCQYQVIMTANPQFRGNAVVQAARIRPQALVPLLDIIDRFSNEQKAAVLHQYWIDQNTNQAGYLNPLLIALANYPQYVDRLLDSIATLDYPLRRTIIDTANLSGDTCASLVAAKRPDLIDKLYQITSPDDHCHRQNSTDQTAGGTVPRSTTAGHNPVTANPGGNGAANTGKNDKPLKQRRRGESIIGRYLTFNQRPLNEQYDDPVSYSRQLSKAEHHQTDNSRLVGFVESWIQSKIDYVNRMRASSRSRDNRHKRPRQDPEANESNKAPKCQ